MRHDPRLPTIPARSQYSTRNTSQSNREEKEIKGIQTAKGEVKSCIVADEYDITYK